MCYAIGNQSKSHKPGLVYLSCEDQRWIVDELRERKRPDVKTTPHLSDVLKNSQALELGEGLLPVSSKCLLINRIESATFGIAIALET